MKNYLIKLLLTICTIVTAQAMERSYSQQLRKAYLPRVYIDQFVSTSNPVIALKILKENPWLMQEIPDWKARLHEKFPYLPEKVIEEGFYFLNNQHAIDLFRKNNPVLKEQEISDFFDFLGSPDIEFLFKYLIVGHDPNSVYSKVSHVMKKTILFTAIDYKRNDLVQLLLDSGANVNQTAQPGNITPLMFAIIAGNKAIVPILINYGADINAVDNYGRNALLYALYKDDYRLASLLIKAGADISLKAIEKLKSGIENSKWKDMRYFVAEMNDSNKWRKALSDLESFSVEKALKGYAISKRLYEKPSEKGAGLKELLKFHSTIANSL